MRRDDDGGVAIAWQRIIAHQCAKFSGKYTLQPPPANWQSRRDQLAKCQQIEHNISELRRQLKAETQFNRQVELNMRIKVAEKELAFAVVSP